jgi:DNA ligase-1
MNRFAELLDRLAYEPARNNKVRLITDYFRATPDPERGWALAALTGALNFPHAKAGLIRSLIAERTDPVLFELSYDYVGDLSETVALMWPAVHALHPRQSAIAAAAGALARCARRDRALGTDQARHRRLAHRHLGAARQSRGRRARR